MVDTRTETDALGSLQVPKESYYGIQTLRALENFPMTTYALDDDFINSLAMVKKASALANYDTGLLNKSIKDAIVQACDEILQGKWHDQFVVDPIQGGAGTSINMNTNEVIANRGLEILGEEKGNYSILSPNSHVNCAQSTNDAVPTAFRMTVLTKLNLLIPAFEDLEESFNRKAEEFDSLIKMGRTHLQDAIPIRLGQEFSAYGSAVQRSVQRLERLRDSLTSVNMGATAVGTGLNASEDYIKRVIEELRAVSGFPLSLASSLIDATQNTDFYSDISSALKTSMLSLSKIANDLRLMASGPRTGLNEINLPQRQPGSSIMPGKVNPVMPELISQINFQVCGNDATVSMAVEAGQFELNVMGPVIFHNILESLTLMTNGAHVFKEHCIDGITANAQTMEVYVKQSVGIITAINPHIGYEKASSIAQKSLDSGRSVREIVLEEGILSEGQLDQLLDPFAMTSPGIIELEEDE